MASAEHLVNLIRRELWDLPEKHPDREIVESTLLHSRILLAQRRDQQLRVGPVQDYKDDPFNPERLTQMWRDIWESWLAGKVAVSLIGECPFAESYLKGLNGYIPLYVPGGYSYSDALFNDLPRVFPRLDQNDEVKATLYSGTRRTGNNLYQMGWMTVEDSVSSQNRDFSREDISRLTQERFREGMTINTYIVASEFSHLMRGWYFDSGSSAPDSDQSLIGIPTSSYLLGSYYRKKFGEHTQDIFVRASYSSVGDLFLSTAEELHSHDSIGLRTVGDNSYLHL